VLSIAPSAAGLIAAASGHELGSDPAIYTSRGSVVLAGVWQHDLGLATPTIDPIHVDAVASGDAVFVALDFGRDGRMLATNVPAVRALEPAHPAFADLGRTIAVAELDPTSGEPRAIQVLRPRTWWWTTLPWQGVPHALAVTHDLVITASDELIRIFPRRGRRVAQATPSELPTLPPIEREPPIDAAAVTEATPMWSELCAARKPHAKNAPCNLASVSLGRDGTVAIGGGYYDINQLGTHVLPKAAFETALFAAYDPRGHARWVKTAGSSWHNAILHVLARDDGRVVVLGYHGQGFAIDGTRVPDRALASNDNAFEVVIGFVAIFDPAGRLELVEDLDTVAYGDRSEDLHRSCMGTLAQGAAADEAWIVALCPHDSFRIHVHGASVSPAQSLGALGALGLFFADAAGRAVVSYPTETRDLLTFDGTRATRTPLIAGSDWNPSPIATSPSATWFATTTGRGETERIVMTSVAANLHETAFELAVGSGFTLSGLSVDEDGRPILAIRYTTELVIGGVRLAGTAWDTRTQGFAFVRLSADGRKIDHVFVAPLDPSGCSHASHGTLTSFVARAQRIVLVFAFGVENRCATDEPSTVMVLATP
jgi:hypothetical protein